MNRKWLGTVLIVGSLVLGSVSLIYAQGGPPAAPNGLGEPSVQSGADSTATTSDPQLQSLYQQLDSVVLKIADRRVALGQLNKNAAAAWTQHVLEAIGMMSSPNAASWCGGGDTARTSDMMGYGMGYGMGTSATD